MTLSRLDIEAIWPPSRWGDTTVLIGVSGGPDSTALLCRLAELRPRGAPGRLVAAHYDHAWRGDAGRVESDFVRDLADKLGCEFTSATASEPPAVPGLGREGAAREARYDFFARAARQFGARYLALGHTRDDQIETVLHRLLRGSGFRGLRGMAPFRAWIDGCSIVRPLLRTPRSDVLAYLEARRQEYLRDPSNRDRSLTRNRIRRELLPLLRRDYNKSIDETLLRLARRAADMTELLEQLVEPLIAASEARVTDNRITFQVAPILAAPRPVRTEFLRRVWRAARWPEGKMAEHHWEAMTKALDGTQPCLSLPGKIELYRAETQVCLERGSE